MNLWPRSTKILSLPKGNGNAIILPEKLSSPNKGRNHSKWKRGKNKAGFVVGSAHWFKANLSMPAALPLVWPKCRPTLRASVPWWTSQEAATATFPAHTTAWIQQTSQWIWTSQHPEVKFAHRRWILLSSPEAVLGEARKPFNPSWHTPWAGCWRTVWWCWHHGNINFTIHKAWIWPHRSLTSCSRFLWDPLLHVCLNACADVHLPWSTCSSKGIWSLCSALPLCCTSIFLSVVKIIMAKSILNTVQESTVSSHYCDSNAASA